MKTKKESNLPVSKKKNSKFGLNKAITAVGCMIAVVFLSSYYIFDSIHKKQVYENLNLSFTSAKEIEYGTKDYDPLKLIKNVKGGKITKYTKNIDTTKVGTQELAFVISNEGIVKEYKININIKDTKAPKINLKQNEVTIHQGDGFDVKSNIESVKDVVDGDIPFNDGSIKDGANYTVSSNFDNNKIGEYDVNITATDSNKNQTTSTYKIKVINKPQTPRELALLTQEAYTNNAPSVDTSSIVSAAQSLMGIRYRGGGTSPETGFDCSGFVKYVYSLFGVNLSGGSSSQLGAGSAVSENNLAAGDIIIWANNGSNSAAHSSIYAGDGTIIHATTNKGVQKTNLNSWKNWGQHIIGIRRV